MLAKAESGSLSGMEGNLVHVEVNLAKGLPSFSIVGLPDTSVREARDRVVAAIRNTGFEFPSRRVTVNLAPAELKKEGPCFDLAIAMGVLMASEAISPRSWPRCIWLGELALDGSLHPIRGALPLVRCLFEKGWRDFVLPEGNVAEVAFLPGLRLFAFTSLREVVRWVQGGSDKKSPCALSQWQPHPTPSSVDLSEIKGQAVAKRALEIAAAGHHNLLLIGTPGTGKSMLAQALPSLLPLWSLEQALDSSQVHSVAGTLNGSGLMSCRPFRSPHHTVSPAALIGGGDVPMPGEISLAHHGVLFLDELPEFRRDALEALRQPLEAGVVHLQRARGRARYPARFLLIAAMNACPCGYRGHPKRECACTLPKVQKYMTRVSGPLLDRIDLQVEVPPLNVGELLGEDVAAESSSVVRFRVEQARRIQQKRFAGAHAAPRDNADLRGKNLKLFCDLPPDAKDLLKSAIERLGFSARAFDRIRRVSRTIADLDGAEMITARHVAEAIQYRILDRPLKGY